jgi:hypothetical protein
MRLVARRYRWIPLPTRKRHKRWCLSDKGVECYERLKNKGPTGASLVDPLSIGITYALIERATADKIPVVSMGYGRADASDGAVFPMSSPCPPLTGRRRTR